MFLLILSVIIIIVSLALSRQQEPFNKIAKVVRIIGGVLLLIGIITSCFVQVDAGYVGVKSLFGKVQNDVLTSGLNFVNPLVDVKEIDVKTQNYTMSGVHDEGLKSGDDAIRVLTADGLEGDGRRR